MFEKIILRIGLVIAFIISLFSIISIIIICCLTTNNFSMHGIIFYILLLIISNIFLFNELSDMINLGYKIVEIKDDISEELQFNIYERRLNFLGIKYWRKLDFKSPLKQASTKFEDSIEIIESNVKLKNDYRKLIFFRKNKECEIKSYYVSISKGRISINNKK